MYTGHKQRQLHTTTTTANDDYDKNGFCSVVRLCYRSSERKKIHQHGTKTILPLFSMISCSPGFCLFHRFIIGRYIPYGFGRSNEDGPREKIENAKRPRKKNAMALMQNYMHRSTVDFGSDQKKLVASTNKWMATDRERWAQEKKRGHGEHTTVLLSIEAISMRFDTVLEMIALGIVLNSV